MAKLKPTKIHYLAVSGKREILAMKGSYGEASAAASMISGGYIIEVSAKTPLSALRIASSEHGCRPDPYLVQELGVRWEFN